MTQEIRNRVADVVKEFQNIAGSKWNVESVLDDHIEFTHVDDWHIRYTVSIKTFGMIDGKFSFKREIKFGSVPSCGSFKADSNTVFDLYSLVGKLVNNERMEELNEMVKAIPFDMD